MSGSPNDYSAEGGVYNEERRGWFWKGKVGLSEIYDNGTLIWTDENTYIHRDGAPAQINEHFGYEYWYHHGLRHRLDGYACLEFKTGEHKWFIEDRQYLTWETFQEARDAYCKRHGISIPGHETSP